MNLYQVHKVSSVHGTNIYGICNRQGDDDESLAYSLVENGGL